MNSINNQEWLLSSLLDHLVDTIGCLKVEEGKAGELGEIQALSHDSAVNVSTWIESLAIVSAKASNSEGNNERLAISLGIVAEIMGEIAVMHDVLIDLEKKATRALNGGDV